MSDDEDWEIPDQLQPDPTAYRFELARALDSVVGVRTLVPSDAFTAGALGTERSGNGVVIRADGLVLTIGYLIAEAETIWLTSRKGAVPGHALAYDHETGFGLIQPLGRLGLPWLDAGDSAGLQVGDAAILAAAGGPRHAVETHIVARQDFSGYWEYLLEDAIFTAPAHPFWGGSALIGEDGRLLGVGSLIVQRADGKGRRLDMNMVVPIDRLAPVIDELTTYGRRAGPPRPWLGLYAGESDDAVVVGGLAEKGPAARAGVEVGDRVLAVEGESITDLASVWRRVWSAGAAGSVVRLLVQRGEQRREFAIESADRSRFLRAPRLH